MNEFFNSSKNHCKYTSASLLITFSFSFFVFLNLITVPLSCIFTIFFPLPYFSVVTIKTNHSVENCPQFMMNFNKVYDNLNFFSFKNNFKVF